MTHNITVYSKPQCVQCDWTYRVLDGEDATYASHDLLENQEAMDTVKSLGYLAAPVVVVQDADGAMVDHWAGFQPERLKKYA